MSIVSRKNYKLFLSLASGISLLCLIMPSFVLYDYAAVSAATTRTAKKSSGKSAGSTRRSTSSRRTTSHRTSSRRGSGTRRKAYVAPKPKYAYPLDFFMMKAPEFDRSPLQEEIASKIREAFTTGIADDIEPAKLVRAGVFHHYPLSGGIFKRREPVKYIVLHSTETGIPVPAKNVINGWNSMGRRHPGAQYVVERDGTIYQALDPELASVHVNIFKTLPGINNDNTIGIEMNHTGRQDYPQPQRQAVMRLVTYLQHRYKVASENVITHKYAQQGDHTDPVNFDLEGFLATKESFKNKAIALKRQSAPAFPLDEATEDDAPLASVYVQIHGPLPLTDPELSRLPKLKGENKLELRPATQSARAGLSAPGSSAASALETPIAMPKGTFVAGGQLNDGSSPESERTEK